MDRSHHWHKHLEKKEKIELIENKIGEIFSFYYTPFLIEIVVIYILYLIYNKTSKNPSFLKNNFIKQKSPSAKYQRA